MRTSLTANVTAGALALGLLSPWLTAVTSIPADDGEEPLAVGTVLSVLAAVLLVTGVIAAVLAKSLEKGHRRSLTKLMRTAWLEPVVLGG